MRPCLAVVSSVDASFLSLTASAALTGATAVTSGGALRRRRHACVPAASIAATSAALASGSRARHYVSATPPLRRKDPAKLTPGEVVDLFSQENPAHGGMSPLDLNLFEDPSGGLAAGPAEELSAAEVSSQLRTLTAAFNEGLYHLLYTPFVDVVALVVGEGLMPAAEEPAASGGGYERQRRPEEVAARWFTDGPTTLRDPHFTARAMGAAPWRSLRAALKRSWEASEAVMPLPRAVAKYGVQAEVFIPFLRQLAMELAEPQRRKAIVAVVPGLTLALANGRAPSTLGLPEDQHGRCMAVAELFLSVGQETGNTDLAYLGTQLLRANDIQTPFLLQKQLTNVFSTSSRVQTDWQVRQAGQLAEMYPKWLEYFRKVRSDNAKQLKLLSQAPEEHTAPDGNRGGKEAVDANKTKKKKNNETGGSAVAGSAPSDAYFTSGGAEALQRITGLEANIQHALLQSLQSPYGYPGRQRGGRMLSKKTAEEVGDMVSAGAEAGRAINSRGSGGATNEMDVLDWENASDSADSTEGDEHSYKHNHTSDNSSDDNRSADEGEIGNHDDSTGESTEPWETEEDEELRMKAEAEAERQEEDILSSVQQGKGGMIEFEI